MLKIIFQSAKKMTVDSEGRAEKDGSLVLEQVVHEPGKPPRTRYWKLRQAAPDRFEGTLTEILVPDAYTEFARLGEILRDGCDGVIERTGLAGYTTVMAARGAVTYRGERVRNYRD